MVNVRRNKKYVVGAKCSLVTKNKNPRISILAFLILLIASMIVFRAYFLQVKSYAYYSALAENQHSFFRKLIPKRGEIFLRDRDGLYPVAVLSLIHI